MTQCQICGRRTEKDDDLCRYHAEAQQNLKDVYERWKHALDITWDEYLTRIVELEGTGRWVKEVIQYLRKEDDS